jgi:hypothetical protein
MVFIRQGGWCKCGRSYNSDADKFEDGVSVYECEELDLGGVKRWRARGFAWSKNRTGVIRSLGFSWTASSGLLLVATTSRSSLR